MTEQEFMRQIWRAYDTVELEGGVRRKVVNVCFPTRSIRVNIDKGVAEWVRCEMIVQHTSISGHPDDIATIEYLHNELMKSQDEIKELKELIAAQKMKQNSVSCVSLQNKVNVLIDSLTMKKKTIERIDKAIDEMNGLLELYKTRINDNDDC